MPKRKLTGTIFKHNNDKTACVKVQRLYKTPLYKKVVKFNKKFHAHDEKNQFKVGDSVIIQECRPISKLKKWVVLGLQKDLNKKAKK
ncbi:MAG: 30S ribosomal protein S17 [Alphaproteobacteria bacterium]|nr:30S ribosomal protein S17 [Alphaproteobacteria bacterium]MBL0718174.1 30S ribosomal protein S17 [Alphaproteobacteria bacterium]